VLCLITAEIGVKNWYRAQSLGSFRRRSTANVDNFWTFCTIVLSQRGMRQGSACKRDLPSSGGNTIAETVTNCGSAGGGVAIMLTLYELGELWAGIHSRRCRGQS
jgi:hypothetical protein